MNCKRICVSVEGRSKLSIIFYFPDKLGTPDFAIDGGIRSFPVTELCAHQTAECLKLSTLTTGMT